MRRLVSLMTVALLSLAALGLSGCQKKVTVKTGERVVCLYGETLSDTVRELSVPAREAREHTVKVRRILCSRHKKAESLYDQAQEQIRRGDLKAAERSLGEVIRIDRRFASAAIQLDAIRSGRTPPSDDSFRPRSSTGPVGEDSPSRPAQPVSPPQEPVPPGEVPTSTPPANPIASLARFVPDTLTGYRASPYTSDDRSITREYSPTGSGDKRVTIVAEQLGTAALVQAEIDRTIKSYYSASSRSIDVDGKRSFFGTDGRDFALLAWGEEGVMVAIQMSSDSGRPASLEGDLVAIARELIR